MTFYSVDGVALPTPWLRHLRHLLLLLQLLQLLHVVVANANVSTVECIGWQWLETDCCRRGKWRRYCCCSAAEGTDMPLSFILSGRCCIYACMHASVWHALSRHSFGLAQVLISYV